LRRISERQRGQFFVAVRRKSMKISVPLKPDEEGMFGRQCPKNECKKYFKVKAKDYSTFKGPNLFCPYCGATAHPDIFLTQDQLEYAESIAVREVLGPLLKQLKSLEMKPDRRAFFSIGIEVDIKEPVIRRYFEKQSRRDINCGRCNRTYSVYGTSYYCPFCGQREPLEVYQENTDTIKRILKLDGVLSEDKDLVRKGKLRELHEDGVFDVLTEKMLDKTVTAFETYCKNKYAAKMVELHPTSSLQDWLKRASNKFQNLDRAEQLLQRDLEYSIKVCLSETDRRIISKAFQKRHVLIHNSGIIDQKYVEVTGEDISLIGTKVQVRKIEVEELISSLTKLVKKIEETL